MSTHAATPAANSDASASSPEATLGVRLAAASRSAQGFTTVMDDPAVLAELRGLCTAPRTKSPPVTGKHDRPAP